MRSDYSKRKRKRVKTIDGYVCVCVCACAWIASVLLSRRSADGAVRSNERCQDARIRGAKLANRPRLRAPLSDRQELRAAPPCCVGRVTRQRGAVALFAARRAAPRTPPAAHRAPHAQHTHGPTAQRLRARGMRRVFPKEVRPLAVQTPAAYTIDGAECKAGMPERIPWEVGKLIFLFVYLAIAGSSNWAVFSFTHDRAGREPLPDILFELLPEQEWAAVWGDWSVTATILCLFSLLIVHRFRLLIVRRAFFIAGTLYAMRSISLLVTQLPPGYENNLKRCRARENASWPIFFSRLAEQTIRVGFQTKEGMLCGDLLFSGHTLVMMTCTLSVYHYLPRKFRILSLIPYFISMCGMIFLIISHTHYTIDVIFAYWLTNFVFLTYHSYVEVDLFVDRKQSVLHSMWIMRIVSWLEEHIHPGRVDNVLEWPLESFFRTYLIGKSHGHHKQISISSASTFGLP